MTLRYACYCAPVRWIGPMDGTELLLLAFQDGDDAMEWSALDLDGGLVWSDRSDGWKPADLVRWICGHDLS